MRCALVDPPKEDVQITMSDRELAETIDRQRVEGLACRFAEPSWLADNRLSAWESYLQTAMPGPRDEEWRRCDLSILDLTKLKAFNLGPARQVAALPTLPQWYQSALEHLGPCAGALFQTTEDGGYLWLSQELADQGVIFLDLASAIEKHPELVRPYLTAAAKGDPDKFALMTKALFNCGAFLYVPANVQLQHSFVVGTGFCGCKNGEHGGAIFPRLIVVAEQNSKVDIVSIMGCESDKRCSEDGSRPVSLSSGLSDVHVNKGARVSYLEVQEFGADVFFIHRFDSHVLDNGQFTAMTLALGGKQTKADIATYLEGKGATSEVLGAVFGSHSEKYNFNTIQEHNAPDTQSDINFRVALKDASSSVYQGIIRVSRAAQKTMLISPTRTFCWAQMPKPTQSPNWKYWPMT